MEFNSYDFKLVLPALGLDGVVKVDVVAEVEGMADDSIGDVFVGEMFVGEFWVVASSSISVNSGSLKTLF